MLTNLFSMFDVSLYMVSPFLFMSVIILMVMATNVSVMIPFSNKDMMMIIVNKQIKAQFSNSVWAMKNLKKNMKNTSLQKFFINLLLLIFLLNFFSLFPFVLSITSHMSLNLTLTVNIWFLSVILTMMNSSKDFFAHMTPSGTPLALMSFMVLIETISNIIRPLTLAVRLMANMVAGHLLLTLLSKFSLISLYYSAYSSIVMLVLGILEMGVSLIQAYVLTLLCVLYIKDAFQ